jgi:hypothetical protein
VTEKVSSSAEVFLATIRDFWGGGGDLLRLKIGPLGCPKTSLGNYHYSLRNNPEEGSSILEGNHFKKKEYVEVFLHYNVKFTL